MRGRSHIPLLMAALALASVPPGQTEPVPIPELMDRPRPPQRIHVPASGHPPTTVNPEGRAARRRREREARKNNV